VINLDLIDIIHRKAVPPPWSEGEKIPWDEPGFSQRMLLEHLSQEHDAASRRIETIERQVEWIIIRFCPTSLPGSSIWAAARGYTVAGSPDWGMHV